MPPTTPGRALRSLTRQCHLSKTHPRATWTLQSRHLAPQTTYRYSSTNTSTNTSADPPNPPSTVDPTEVSHFNALASSWWDPHGPSRLLHLMNPLRHDFISRCRSPIATPTSSIADAPRKLRYLDIGCGGGIFAESAARLQTTESVTGIDPTPEVLKIAEAHRRRDPGLLSAAEGGSGPAKLTYRNTSIEALPLPKTEDEAYDIVTLFEVLEHVTAPAPFLTHILPHVKPGGWLVMSTIARTWTSWLVTNVMAEDVLGIVPKGTHDWAKYVNEAELREWFVKKGWPDVRVMGVVYVPGFGWREVSGGEGWGNYFIGVRRPLE